MHVQIIDMNRQKLNEAFAERERIERRMKEILSFLNLPSLFSSLKL